MLFVAKGSGTRGRFGIECESKALNTVRPFCFVLHTLRSRPASALDLQLKHVYNELMVDDLVKKWTIDSALSLRRIVSRLKICPCGTSAHWVCILELLTEAEKHTNFGFYRDQWVEFGAKVLDTWRLLDHGTGIGFAWLTDDGKLLLEFLRDFGTKDHDMNDGSGHPAWAVEFWGDGGDVSDPYGDWSRSRPNVP